VALAPEEVFTPATPVSDDMFANRKFEDLQDRVEAALREHGRQVVLFGLTGVGKTSLIEHLCRERRTSTSALSAGQSLRK
jgi:putative ribosome biogenesis GTPase RsgA